MKKEVYEKFLESINYKELLEIKAEYEQKIHNLKILFGILIENIEYICEDEEIINDFLMYDVIHKDDEGLLKMLIKDCKLYLISKNQERIYEFVGHDTVRIK